MPPKAHRTLFCAGTVLVTGLWLATGVGEGAQGTAPAKKRQPANPSGKQVGTVREAEDKPLELAAWAHTSLARGCNDSFDAPITLMRTCWARLSEMQDYQGLFFKEERIGGRLRPVQFVRIKVRHKPYSVYLKWLKPGPRAGQECLWVDGKWDNKSCVRLTGTFRLFVKKALFLPTDSPQVMSQTRHPVSDCGMLRLAHRLLTRWKVERTLNESRIVSHDNAKVDGRPCYFIKVQHPVDRKTASREFGGPYLFYKIHVYVDKEWMLPIRFEGYDWPNPAAAAPRRSLNLLGVLPTKQADPRTDADGVLLEKYTYLRLKFNTGLADKDFDWQNPKYGFR